MKSLSTLLRGKTSNHNGDIYFLRFRSYNTKEKLEKHEKVCNDHNYCHVEMPNNNKILKYSHGEKPLNAPFMIYADLECLLEKCTHVKIILKNLIQRKKLSMNLIQYLQIVHLMKQKKIDCYKGEDCMERF